MLEEFNIAMIRCCLSPVSFRLGRISDDVVMRILRTEAGGSMRTDYLDATTCTLIAVICQQSPKTFFFVNATVT